MASRKPASKANPYRFPGVDPDDKTLGGAVPPELFDRLTGNTGPQQVPDDQSATEP